MPNCDFDPSTTGTSGALASISHNSSTSSLIASLAASDLVQFVLLFVLVHLALNHLLNCNDLLHFRQALPSSVTNNSTPIVDYNQQQQSIDDNDPDRLPRVNDNEELDNYTTTVTDLGPSQVNSTKTISVKCDINANFEPSDFVDNNLICDLPPTTDKVVGHQVQVSQLFTHRLHRSSVTSLGPCNSDFQVCYNYLDSSQHNNLIISTKATNNPAKMVDMVHMNNGASMHFQHQQNSQDGYMEQEEEWEREGLLDPAWEKQQRKVRYPFIFVH